MLLEPLVRFLMLLLLLRLKTLSIELRLEPKGELPPLLRCESAMAGCECVVVVVYVDGSGVSGVACR